MISKIYLLFWPCTLLFLHYLGFATPIMQLGFGDPDYGYLLNSLLLLDGRVPVHIDHPGTTVQVLGAVVIRIAYLFQDGKFDLIDSVLSFPYFYLYWISVCLAIMLALSVLCFGRKLSAAGMPWWIVITGQSTPLLLPSTWIYLTRVCPEILSVTLAVLIAALIMPLDGKTWGIKKTLLVGTTLGAGIAGKINFLPLTGLLLLSGSSAKFILGIIACASSFVLITCPIWSEYHRLFGWLTRIFFHSRNYGHGAPGVVPSAETIQQNFLFLWENARAYFLLPLLLPLAAANALGEKKKLPHLYPLLIGTLVLAAQLVLVLKQVAERYLLPALGVWALLIPHILHFPSRKIARLATLGFTMAILAISFQDGFTRWWRVVSSYPHLDRPARELDEKIAEFPECGVIFAPSVTAPQFPLYGGDLAVNGYFTKRLQRLYPDTIFYDIYPGRFRSFGEILSLEQVRSITKLKKCYLLRASSQIKKKNQFLMTGAKMEMLDEVKHPFKLKPVLEKKFEGLYLIENI